MKTVKDRNRNSVGAYPAPSSSSSSYSSRSSYSSSSSSDGTLAVDESDTSSAPREKPTNVVTEPPEVSEKEREFKKMQSFSNALEVLSEGEDHALMYNDFDVRTGESPKFPKHTSFATTPTNIMKHPGYFLWKDSPYVLCVYPVLNSENVDISDEILKKKMESAAPALRTYFDMLKRVESPDPSVLTIENVVETNWNPFWGEEFQKAQEDEVISSSRSSIPVAKKAFKKNRGFYEESLRSYEKSKATAALTAPPINARCAEKNPQASNVCFARDRGVYLIKKWRNTPTVLSDRDVDGTAVTKLNLEDTSSSTKVVARFDYDYYLIVISDGGRKVNDAMMKAIDDHKGWTNEKMSSYCGLQDFAYAVACKNANKIAKAVSHLCKFEIPNSFEFPSRGGPNEKHYPPQVGKPTTIQVHNRLFVQNNWLISHNGLISESRNMGVDENTEGEFYVRSPNEKKFYSIKTNQGGSFIKNAIPNVVTSIGHMDKVVLSTRNLTCEKKPRLNVSVSDYIAIRV
jgi:hypothetical protein